MWYLSQNIGPVSQHGDCCLGRQCLRTQRHTSLNATFRHCLHGVPGLACFNEPNLSDHVTLKAVNIPNYSVNNPPHEGLKDNRLLRSDLAVRLQETGEVIALIDFTVSSNLTAADNTGTLGNRAASGEVAKDAKHKMFLDPNNILKGIGFHSGGGLLRDYVR